ALAERGGRPVEQLRVSRKETGAAEVARRGDDPLAEVMLPQPIDQDAGRQRVVLAGDPVGQDTTPARRPGSPRRTGQARLRLLIRGAEYAHEARLDRLARRRRAAARQNMRRRRGRAVLVYRKRQPTPFQSREDGPVGALLLRLDVGLDVAQEGEHRVVIFLANRVELVIVTAGAANRQAEEGAAGDGQHVVQLVKIGLALVVGLVVPDADAVERSRRQRIVGDGVQLVAGELFADEAVIGLVVVKRADDIVAVTPGVRLLVVAFVTVGLTEADHIEPVAAPALAVLRRGKQSIDEALRGVRASGRRGGNGNLWGR